LDARVGGTEQVAEELVLLIIIAEQRTGDLEEVRVLGALARRLAEGGEFEVDVAYEFAVVICFHKISRM
jgi:hypothetical protein